MSTVDATAIASATNNANPSTTVTNTKNGLGKDDFLKLLMTQMENQDPTKPMDDTATIAQLAQFSSLEQMHNINTANLATQANSMIGKNITWTDNDSVVQTGTVTGTKFVTGQPPTLMVGNVSVPLVGVMEVTENSPVTGPVKPSAMPATPQTAQIPPTLQTAQTNLTPSTPKTNLIAQKQKATPMLQDTSIPKITHTPQVPQTSPSPQGIE